VYRGARRAYRGIWGVKYMETRVVNFGRQIHAVTHVCILQCSFSYFRFFLSIIIFSDREYFVSVSMILCEVFLIMYCNFSIIYSVDA
jgi:hypothetical protein